MVAHFWHAGIGVGCFAIPNGHVRASLTAHPPAKEWLGCPDPFKLTEKDGYYYGHGTADDKFMAATFVANLIRYKQEGYRPDRDIIVALETDEEIGDVNALGIRWLINNHRDLIDAEFALNEGGGVGLKHGKPIRNGVTKPVVYSPIFRSAFAGCGHDRDAGCQAGAAGRALTVSSYAARNRRAALRSSAVEPGNSTTALSTAASAQARNKIVPSNVRMNR